MDHFAELALKRWQTGTCVQEPEGRTVTSQSRIARFPRACSRLGFGPGVLTCEARVMKRCSGFPCTHRSTLTRRPSATDPPESASFARSIPPWFVLSVHLITINTRAIWVRLGAFPARPFASLQAVLLFQYVTGQRFLRADQTVLATSRRTAVDHSLVVSAQCHQFRPCLGWLLTAMSMPVDS